MSTEARRYGLILEPLDILLFRDGRPLIGGWQVESGLPLPQTLAGSIRTWLLTRAGCDFERLGEAVRAGLSLAEAAREGQPEAVSAVFTVQVRGPWLAMKSEQGSQGWTPLVPAPANLVQPEGANSASAGPQLERLDPLGTCDLPGWSPPLEGLRPLWRFSSQPAKKAEGFVTLRGLGQYLQGGVPAGEDWIRPDALYDLDTRTGIAVGATTRAVEEGAIYGASYLSLKPGVAFYGELVDPQCVLESLNVKASAAAGSVRFGGDSKRARLTLSSPVEWPEVEDPGAQGVLILLTTPCPVDASRSGADLAWLPASLREGLVAAAVPGYRAFSGWDLARRGPKPARFAIDAGSVYFLKPGFKSEELGSLCSAEDSAAGWGQFVKGVWNYV